MALFTQFLQHQRRAEQALRASGRSNLSETEMANVASSVGAIAEAEEEGRAAEAMRSERREDIEAGQGRFRERLGVARENLALAKERAAIDTELGRGRLALAKHEFGHTKKMKPWVIGLGATELAIAAKQRSSQQKRDAELMRIYQQLIKRDLGTTSRKRPSSGHLLSSGGGYYT